MFSSRKAFLLFGFFIALSSVSKADTISGDCVHQLILNIKAFQSTDSLSGFPPGIFSSYRQFVYRPGVLKKDDNFFFTGLILFTLNEIAPKLNPREQLLIEAIRDRAKSAFPLYQNKNNGPTYNFWRTRPQKIFPNGGWLNWFDKQQSLPDDFDDTAIGLLAGQADTETVKAVHQYMQGFTNTPPKRIINTFKDYRQIPAYSVWFGKKFPVDFDICVASNVLYLVSKYKLKWTSADSATLRLIEKMIDTKDIFTHPDYVSPHYHTTPIILYHLSRLMSVRPDLLANQKDLLIREAQNQFILTKDQMTRVILSTALKRWGVDLEIDPVNCFGGNKNYTEDGFVFFIANMASMLPNPLKSVLGKKGIGRFNYYCPAYNLALVLENQFTEVRK